MSPKPSESNLRGELRVSEATERGGGSGRGCNKYVGDTMNHDGLINGRFIPTSWKLENI